MAQRTLKVTREGAVLFETSLNEREVAGVRAAYRVHDPRPETPEYRPLADDEDPFAVGALCDFVVEITLEPEPEPEPEPKRKGRKAKA